MYCLAPNFSTVEDEIFVDRPDDPEVLDDYEFFKDEVTAIKDNVLYKQKVKRRASQYKVYFLGIFLSCYMFLPYACLCSSALVPICVNSDALLGACSPFNLCEIGPTFCMVQL